MHALGRYILEQMDRQGITRSELIRRSGLSKQTIYNLLNDPRARMDQTPQRKTIEKLAGALGVPEGDVLIASAEAIGVPVAANVAPLASASDAQLLEELRLRLATTYKERDGDAEAAPIARAGESPATHQERRERPDEDFLPSDASTSSRETGRRSVDMEEFSARRQRIIRREAEVDVEPDAEIEAPLGAVARRNAKAKKEAGDDWENV